MNKFKGTAGEWQQNGKNGIHVKGKSTCVALTFNNENGEDSREADGRLISASPDLLSFAIDFIEKVESGRAKSTDSYNKAKLAVNKALNI